MKVAILTSSRADYGIYLPLLKALKEDSFFELNIIVFGTHVSTKYGNTIDRIFADGFDISLTVDSIPEDDSPVSISKSMGVTMDSFSAIWDNNSFDLVIALGDRYEMFAACASVLPFGLPIAHIHGGETTLGAIDDAFRNSITHMATLHFTIANEYCKRVIELKGSDKYVYNVGALSIDNLKTLRLLSKEKFKEQFNIDLKIPSILVTFHPETVDFQMNKKYIGELISAMWEFSDYQIVITMPNADTMGNMIREKLIAFIKHNKNAIGVESLGTLGYLSCMKHCSFMLGNTSSGFVEASYFPKYVVNLGRRQLGRLKTENIYNCQLKKNKIIEAVNNYKTFKPTKPIDIYGDGNAANKIISILKSIKFE